MNRKSIYAFYGSLRKGMSNHKVYCSALHFLSKEVIPGFQLFEMEEYPYAIRTGDRSHLLTVEIYRITDAATEHSIHQLELEVGYYYDEVTVRDQPVGIYLYKKPGHERLVKSGDWVQFFGSR